MWKNTLRLAVFLMISLLLCLVSRHDSSAASLTVDDFVGSWAGNWDGPAPNNSNLIISKNADGKATVRYTYRARSWDYIGVVKKDWLTFSSSDGWHYYFYRPQGAEMKGELNGPNNISARISMTRVGGEAKPEASALPSPTLQPAEFVPPPQGTVVTYRTANDRGGGNTYRQIIRYDVLDGRPVVISSSPDDKIRIYFDKATASWLQTTIDGKPRSSAEPSWGDFQWPLQVGKTWVANYQYNDHASGQSWSDSEQTWIVEATETVVVPAGTFDTFRLRSTPGRNVAVITTRWYAPELGLLVKQRSERTTDHYRGIGWETNELLEYKKP